MHRPTRLRPAALLLLATSVPWSLPAQTAQDTLQTSFNHPPASARPRVWWHWMNGNITKEGIKLDLEWMHNIGLAGFQNFDAALATPQVVDKRLAYMTPEWKDAFRYAIGIADQYGMETAIAGSPGWSESGGPWVPPAHGMKKYVWSETSIEGGKPFHGRLAHPPTVTGAFQNVGIREEIPGFSEQAGKPEFYADAAVVAFRRTSQADPQGKLSASGGSPDLSLLADGDVVKTIEIPIPEDGSQAWIQWEYPQPTTIRAVTLATSSPTGLGAVLAGFGAPEKTLEASDDGVTFRPVQKLEEQHTAQTTIAVPETTARYFRVSFKKMPPPPLPAWAQGMDLSAMGGGRTPKVTTYKVAELVLHTAPRVDHFEVKAAFTPAPDLYGFATPESGKDQSISDVVDLTAKMQPDGTLDWTPPAGDWVVLRFGYSLLGITNHPATKEATGLEVDKLNRAYVRDYFEKYLDSYKQTVGADMMGKRGIQYVINDSWEAGAENWTDDMVAQFTRLRGYSPLPWMPVLAGYVVKSPADSDRFLWDLRHTIADLTATEHYEELEKILHERNMGHYGESHEDGRALIADGMQVKKYNEIPMSAMWTQSPGVNHEQFGFNADDRESASVAHIYGQNLVAAESMTAGGAAWAWSPATLKPTADQEFLNGINRFVIHESAHQPLVGKAPGLTLGPFGQWFNRNETWAQQAGVWIDYLARTSYLLQQGRFNADVLYYYGEDSNLTAIFAHSAPNVPAGYGFDYVNADALQHEFKVAEGRITTVSGMRYQVLALDPYSRHMSLPVLKAIHTLVEAGATVVGPKPIDDPSLSDSQAEFARLSAELFGDGSGVHQVGKGTVYAGQTAADALQAMHVAQDFGYTKPTPTTRLEFVHRALPHADVYFVDNRGDDAVAVDATFRVAGKEPELWYAETGRSRPVSYTIAAGRTTVPLKLEPWGTVFVVFRKPTTRTSRTLPAEVESRLATLDGPWQVAFQQGRGAPMSATLPQLIDLSTSQDTGIRYFSGTATYTKTIDADAAWLHAGKHIWLDLGDVQHMAEVKLNGKSLGIVWHAPYRVDVTEAIHAGSNQLEVQVTNSWVNRLIGDQQPDATTKYTFTTVKPYRANSRLQASGLVGPVTVQSVGTK
ncbi:MAG: glycoside hydrolase [Acidobacteriota bacterium]|nr:glycoside hydrolase [Acidobacteriota bacterium]